MSAQQEIQAKTTSPTDTSSFRHLDLGSLESQVDLWSGSEDPISALRQLVTVCLQVGAPQPVQFWSKALHRLENDKRASMHFDLMSDLGRVLWRKGRIEDAQRIWEKILAQLPLYIHLDERTQKQLKMSVIHNIGDLLAQQGAAEEAMSLYSRALNLAKETEDHARQSGIYHAMALLQQRLGQYEQAEGLYRSAWDVAQELGDAQALMAIAHQLAQLKATRGQYDEAMHFYKEVLLHKEQLGGTQSKATTLGSMAWVASQQGNDEQARAYNLEAATLLASLHAWPDLVNVLSNMGSATPPDSNTYLAQALWLALRVGSPLDTTIALLCTLYERFGPDAEASPWLAATALYLAEVKGKGHPQQAELLAPSQAMVSACARERHIEMSDLAQWLTTEGMNNPKRLIKRTNTTLEALIQEEEWLFEANILRLQDLF